MQKPRPFFFETFGFGIWRGTPPLMRRLHSHTEVEFNLLIRGSITYRFAGEPVSLAPDTLYVFGGVTPHELEHVARGSEYVCLTIPLAAFIRWRLPENVSAPIIGGEILSDRDAADDLRRFTRWLADIESGDPRRARVILPEVQARMERMALSSSLASAWSRARESRTREGTAASVLKVERMLQTISARFAESLSLAQICQGTGWHPHYAASQFQRLIGLSPGRFLMQQRVAHAKQLLVTGEAKVIDVSEACGFASQSSFYAAFTRLARQTPAAYRRANVSGKGAEAKAGR